MDEHLSASGSQPELETKSVQPLCKAVPGNAGTNALFNFFIDQENKFLGGRFSHWDSRERMDSKRYEVPDAAKTTSHAGSVSNPRPSRVTSRTNQHVKIPKTISELGDA